MWKQFSVFHGITFHFSSIPWIHITPDSRIVRNFTLNHTEIYKFFTTNHDKWGKLSFTDFTFHANALCSRNFQNVKLRLDFVDIWWFYRHSDFTWNQVFANSNGPKMSFLAILKVLNFDFTQFEQLSSPKFTKIQSSESPKLPKMTFFGPFEFTKIWFHVKSEWR